MARLFKNACVKMSSHPKLCSYSTKANPYEEVLKTLKVWEQELKNKNQNSKRRSDGHLSKRSVSRNERSLNVQENTPMNKDSKITKNSERTIKRNEGKFCDKSVSETFEIKPDHRDVSQGKSNIRGQAFHNDSQNFFPREDILIFTGEHPSNHFIIVNDSNFLTQFLNDTYPKNSPTTSQQSRRTRNHSFNANKFSNSDKSFSRTKSSKSPEVLETQKPGDKYLLNNSASPKEMQTKEDDLKVLKQSPMKFETKVTGDKSVDKLTLDDRKFKSTSVKSKTAALKAEKASSERENLKNEARITQAIQSLTSSIEAYINANKIDQAQRYFEYVNKRKKEYLNIELYNIIIAGWAKLGRLDKVKHLFSLMKDDNIRPNLMTYAGYLEAIARSKIIDVGEIPDIVNRMKAEGFTPKDLLQKGVFVGNQREKVLQVLGFVERDLDIPLYVAEDAYCFKLLQKLNDKDYERGDNHFNHCFNAEDIPVMSATQMELENHSSIKIKSVNACQEMNDKVEKSREYLSVCEKQWREVLTKKINDLKTPKLEQGNPFFSDRRSIHAYLSLIDTEILVNLLLLETRMLAETAEFFSPNVKFLYKDLGLKVMRHYFMALNEKNAVTEKVHFIYKKYLNYLLNPDLCAQFSPREYWEFLKSKYCDGATIDVSNVSWPFSLIIYMGSVMYDVMVKTICFNPNRVLKKSEDKYITPAFRVKYENLDVKLYKQMRTHDVFAKLYRDAKLDYLEFDVTLVPMLSPPHPWVKYDSGGLLITKVPLIRFPEHAQSMQNTYYSKVPPNQLNACFDSLNSLSLCPWIINKPILDIVTKIFQDGGSEKLDIPLNPANFKIDSKSITGESEEAIKLALRKALREYEKQKGEMTSLWFDCLYKLSIANHFRDKIFWFPHNLDFRGRVYPTPPHFNHLGSDLSRSILLFAAGKPLGKKGLDWLKIHLINLTGFKKRASHVERLAYANEMLPEILDSADNPFGKSRWWMSSDKPLQTLACCMEVASAVRHPNPEEYISHLPVHQDGSCNGLQHYAALGRDELGAIEVNLHPSHFPQDVYSGVAALVEKERDKDANDGVEIAQVLKGFITRKVVKQTVMTFVYGVTPYGARLQVLKQLKDMPEFPEKYQHEAATYLMKKIFHSIKEMFTATKRIQDWFTQCAEEITRVTGDAVEWVTPLGLPVIQPYYKQTLVRSSKFCVAKSSDLMHYSSSAEPYELPNVRKQKNAFAPNFIHSLDSTHMMLTSLFCHRKGITFVSVHDCYWTHALTVAEMNKICREQFVSLHSEPILGNLSAFFVKRYLSTSAMKNDLSKKGIKERKRMQAVLKAVPEIGTFDLKLVLDSEYFFS